MEGDGKGKIIYQNLAGKNLEPQKKHLIIFKNVSVFFFLYIQKGKFLIICLLKLA
jgi:hypothetical protein